MTAERWAQIAGVFRAALEKPAGERAAFLEEACGADEALRRGVEQLLAGEGEPSLPSPLPELLQEGALELSPGHMLAQYRVEAKIGEGGMGEVYRAYDSRLHRKAALKVLPPETMVDPDRIGRFQREARAASALNHPNIVTVYEIGSDSGVNFIAMEYVPGRTLAATIGRKGLALRDVLNHAVQIASALAAAHRAGIVHRDLKPANIMVNDAGQVKVLDFGLARRTERTFPQDAGSAHTLEAETGVGTVFGTVAYMSPEQAEGKRLDPRSDIFSFGVVLYEMVTGKRAFERDSTTATLAAILKEEPEPPGRLAAVPPGLEKILARCLRKDPAHRFQCTQDLAVALEELKQALEAGRPALPKRFPKLGWAAGFALLLGAAVAGFWSVRLRTSVPEAEPAPVPLTSYPGREESPSFSPDGTQVAFQRCPEGKACQVYVKQIGVEPPAPLTGSSMASHSPAWSPDGRTIACRRRLPSAREAIVLVPVRGGRERILSELEDDTIPEGPLLAWTPDSKWLATPVSEPASSGRRCWALFLYSVETGERRRLSNPPDVAEGGDFAPAFSPDGSVLAFSRGNDNNCDLYLLRLAKGYVPQGEPDRIASDNLINKFPVWTPDGRAIVFCSGAFRGYDLWRVATAARAKPRRLTFASGLAAQAAVSRSGGLVYPVAKSDSNIWGIELGPTRHRPGIPARFIGSTRNDMLPAYSPDGTRIAFVSDRSGAAEIWACGSDGSNATQLTSLGASDVYGPQWSPDGENIAFHANPRGNDDIYVIGADGGAPRRLTTTPAVDQWPSWSRDGKWLYFVSDRAPGGIWRMSAAGGEAVRIASEGICPRVSSGGKWLFCSKGYPHTLSLWRMPLDGGEEAKVLDGVIDWTLGKAGIYFITPPDEQGRGRNICLQEFATGKIRTIATTDRRIMLGMAVSPDGRTLLYSQWDEYGSDLILVPDFHW